MAYAVEYEVPGNEQIYAKVKAEIGEETPDGMVVHFVVKSEGGLRHFEVWDSQQDWERFRDERVDPAVGKVLASLGFEGERPTPHEQVMEVVDVWTGTSASVAR